MERRTNISIGIPPIATLQGDDGSDKLRLGPAQYQNTECVLYGSVLREHKDKVLERLRGLCDPGRKYFQEHNMCFKLKTGFDSPVQVQLRRLMNGESRFWCCRYVGIPEVDPKVPVIVRKTIDSTVHSLNMMDFIKSLGLRIDYEYIADGYVFSNSRIRVYVYNVNYTENVGNYQKSNMKSLTDSCIVEAIIMLPDGVPYEESAKRLRDFCDHLMPLCEMRKVDYMKDAAT